MERANAASRATRKTLRTPRCIPRLLGWKPLGFFDFMGPCGDYNPSIIPKSAHLDDGLCIVSGYLIPTCVCVRFSPKCFFPMAGDGRDRSLKRKNIILTIRPTSINL